MGRIGDIYFDVVRHDRSRIYHAASFGKTLCGRRVTNNSKGTQWGPVSGGVERDVSCETCRRVLDAADKR